MSTINKCSRENIGVPSFLYGTAWKEERTEVLTTLALEAGFRGIDTANQRRHYYEEGVGAALTAAYARGLVRREELFLQTKFTYKRSQDHRLPYDPAATPAEQVEQSFASSQRHLQAEIIDSYVLHGPSTRKGLAPTDHEVWRAMEGLHAIGKVRFLGVSNVNRGQLEALCEFAEVRPTFVQNRCYARTGWDQNIRIFCAKNDIRYQGFSLLTANRDELATPLVEEIVARSGGTLAQVVFRFAVELGVLPLTGTSDPIHMREDLASSSFELSAADIHRLEEVGLG